MDPERTVAIAQQFKNVDRHNRYYLPLCRKIGLFQLSSAWLNWNEVIEINTGTKISCQ
jgi:hypothetical protein